MNDFTVADALALSKNGGSADGFGGTWTWVFFLFFLLAWGGGGLFGGGGNGSATEGALTRAAMYESNNMQDMYNGLESLSNQINNFQTTSTNAWGNIRYDNLKNMTDLSAQIAQNRYAADQCCCETNRNIDALKFSMSKEYADGVQKIADMINEDRIETLRSQLTDARNQITNLVQSNNIVNQVRPFPTPTYLVNSPYGSAYGACNNPYVSYGY
jgi:uncharacterized protein YukE